MITQLIHKIKKLYQKDPALFVIWSSILGLTIILYSFFYSFNAITINTLSVEKNNTQVQVFDDKSIINETYAIFNENHSTVDVDTNILPSTTFKFETIANRTQAYEVFFNFIGKKIYYKEQNSEDIFQLPKEVSMDFLLNEQFVFIYPMGSEPVSTFSLDDKSVDISYTTNWSVKRIDGKFYNYVTDKISESNDSPIKNTHLIMHFEKEPNSMIYNLYKDGALIETGSDLIEEFPIPKINGQYKLNLILNYNDELHNQYYGSIQYSFDFNVDNPPFFEIGDLDYQQGELIKIYAYNFKDQEPFISQNLFDKVEFFKKDEQSYIAYIPTWYLTKESTYNIRLSIDDEVTDEISVDLKEKELSIQYLIIDESIEAETRSAEAYAEFDRIVPPLRQTSEPFAYFRDDFILPVDGRLTTEYGETRYVNGAPTAYFHSGLDIAAPTGTPIHATNTGKVVFADNLTLTGKTVIIDHGTGFMSIYYHMHSIDVEEEQIVNIGEEIGTVGTTGFSTGPHLHFMIGYYDVNLAPGYLIFGEEVTYENYRDLFN